MSPLVKSYILDSCQFLSLIRICTPTTKNDKKIVTLEQKQIPWKIPGKLVLILTAHVLYQQKLLYKFAYKFVISW